MNTIKHRLLTCLLAALLCCAAFSTTAFAKGAPEEAPPPEVTPEPTMELGEPFDQGSDFNTRDLLYDKATNKQFITVSGRDGAVFYIIIDYDAPVNDKEEQYATYFLNQVDEADLMALLEEGETPACSCTDKCETGAVNVACPVCKTNTSGCVGKAKPAPEPVEPTATPEPEKASGNPAVMIALVLALLGGGAFAFFKFFKKKPASKAPAILDDYDFYEDEDDAAETTPDTEAEPETDSPDADEEGEGKDE